MSKVKGINNGLVCAVKERLNISALPDRASYFVDRGNKEITAKSRYINLKTQVIYDRKVAIKKDGSVLVHPIAVHCAIQSKTAYYDQNAIGYQFKQKCLVQSEPYDPSKLNKLTQKADLRILAEVRKCLLREQNKN
ncbi:hypothetical protein BVY03_05235 [bacterium K02(2017)]|nr:hypothetical protein BVY03_05235 [bacterium K02(2017)]